ncbi:hypothetical protein FBQ81_06120 [Chloroflexi bacterium CFX6]|nr:hypothetical protein [Chloroflexi bacterium CFX6]
MKTKWNFLVAFVLLAALAGFPGATAQAEDMISTTTTLASSQDPSLLGESVTFTATVSPAPEGGTVAFKDGGAAIAGCEAQPLTGGQATCTIAAMAAGMHVITAEYSGDSTYDPSASTTRVQAVYTRPAVEAGGGHTCGLRADGTLHCWGYNSFGQTMVPAPNESWVQVSAGTYHTCGLKADGTLQCWGLDDSSQTDMPAPNASWVQVSAGGGHTCGLKADGTIQCWGNNPYGQTTVPAPNANWVQVGAGAVHTCGLKADGTLQCWGENYYGQTTVPAPNASWAQVSAGGVFTCGLKAGGTLQCWGSNYYGQTNVPAPNENWTQVSAGGVYTCGLKADGTLQCWGNNTDGQTNVPALNADWAQVSTGGDHTCGLKADGTFRCWGYNEEGQAPVITLAPELLPNATPGTAYTQNITASGGSATPYTFSVISGALPPGLTLNSDGTWGGAPTTAGTFTFTVQAADANNVAAMREYSITVGQIGTVTTLASSANPSLTGESVTFTALVSPAPDGGTVVFKDGGAAIGGCEAQPLTGGGAACTTSALAAGMHAITAEYSGDPNYTGSASATLVQAVHARPAVAAGGVHTCGLRADGTLHCWGWNYYGQTDVPAPNENWLQVSAGDFHTCGLKADGTLQCWGEDDFWRTRVPAPNANWAQVSAGGDHTCGLKADGTLRCWGRNNVGQTNVPAPNANWVQVGAGDYHTCGLKADGTLQCWGENYYGQTNVPAPNASWVQVSAGAAYTCGLRADGTLQCWGSNYFGQSNVPAPNANWAQVSAGGGHICGLKADGALQCWGFNYFGQTAVPVPNANWVQVSAGREYTCGLKAGGTLRCWGRNGLGQAPIITLAPDSLPNATVGAAYSQNITASGGSATPYTFSVTSGAVPTGLSLNSDGTWSGAPTEVGTFNFTVQAADANNIAAARAYTITVSAPLFSTPPVITSNIVGTSGQDGWYTSDVSLTWTVTDDESAITSQIGCDDVSITTDQQETAYTCTATSAGGTSSETVNLKRDATPPTLNPVVTPNPVLLNGSATANPGAGDALSGVASSSCDAVDTSTVGSHTLSCTATDNAGNTATASAAYSVIYNFIGFSSPVDSNDVLNLAKAGQTIPLKFRVTDANGSPITNLTGAAVTAASLSCPVGTTTDLLEEYAAGNSGLQNLGDGYYQWNWKTPTIYANSCKTLRLDLGEGIYHTALFQFRK